MAMIMQVLGQPGDDNAMYLKVDSGQAVTRLLFDCGENCLAQITFSEIQAMDHLFFSHLHMDHIAGFDQYFRANYARAVKTNEIWGPPGSARIMSHRFQGYWWNLNENMQATWLVHEIHNDRVETFRFELVEAFAIIHYVGTRPHQGTIIETSQMRLDVQILDHHGPCVAYKVAELPKQNIDTTKLPLMGLRPGPWLQQLKDPGTTGLISIQGMDYDLATLRQKLIRTVPGEIVAYVTDFHVAEPGMSSLASWLQNCGRVLCEAQYREADLELALRHYHMTTRRVSQIAAKAEIGELILFHLSCRYQPADWREMLEECRSEFPNTRFPDGWEMKS